ncbi:MAG TPA: hypothetical protein PKK99_15890 [Bacteroidia bacterium]|nr:hypothetical protein [Bacteroidia bacterium]
MNIELNSNTKIEEIQSEFSKRFPYLKINFFQTKFKPGIEVTPEDILPSFVLLKDVSGLKLNGSIHINGLMTVKELENQFRIQGGLHVEVFRKSGKIWLKTSASDQWTLDEQNKEARDSQLEIKTEKEDSDYHEQE